MAKISFDQILKSDVIRKVDMGYTFVTSCDGESFGDLCIGDTLTLTYSTLRTSMVFINNQEIEPNGTLKLAPKRDTICH